MNEDGTPASDPSPDIAPMALSLATRQRDEASARVVELEAIIDAHGDAPAEVMRLRELLRKVGEIVGAQEFDSILEVVQLKMDALALAQREPIQKGLEEAARVAALSRQNDEIVRLREEVARLKSR